MIVPETDVKIYANAMAGIRDRINFIQTVDANNIRLPSTDYKAEVMFLQFRKVLEEIAFSTIAANKDAYSRLRANFSVHWKAKAILEQVKKLNPNFYPVPIKHQNTIGNEHHFDVITGGYMTPDEFVTLYEVSSEMLHTRNPYRDGDEIIQTKYTVQEWVTRIQTLLSWHGTHLLNRESWFIQIPETGPVHAYPARKS